MANENEFIATARSLGASGSPAIELERQAFEAWVAGHCWSLGAQWENGGYRSPRENGSFVDPAAMMTRRMWAAWRDRGALAAVHDNPALSSPPDVRGVAPPPELPPQ